MENESMAFASVVLPMAAPVEQEGTWTNCEGRVQKLVQAIPAPGESKPSWRIFGEMILRLNASVPYFNAREVAIEISKEVESFKSIDFDAITEEGVLLNLKGEPVLAADGV